MQHFSGSNRGVVNKTVGLEAKLTDTMGIVDWSTRDGCVNTKAQLLSQETA